MSKKLTLTEIKNENKVYDKKKKIDLSDDFHVFIYPHFSPTKITELIKEIITDKQRAEKEGINFDEINMTDWILFNIIYKFADLGIPSEIKKKVMAFAELVNYKYFGKIIESFPEESILEFKDSLQRFNENLTMLMKSEGFDLDKAIEEIDRAADEDDTVTDENKIVQ